MKNYPVPIRVFVCFLVSALMLAGCAESDLAAVHPQVVRKKIVSPTETLPPPSQTVALPAPAASAAEPSPALAAAGATQDAAAPSPLDGQPTATTPSVSSQVPALATAKIVEPIRPVAATQPPVPAPEPQTKKLESTLASTDSQVAALLNLQAQAPYNPKGKVDPFEALLREESVQPVGSKPLRKKRDPQGPLEKIDLGQLRLVAIITATSGNRALVEEATGKGYILREGTFVGLNSGKVVDIAIDKVMVEEEFEDAYGKTITQKKEITLPKPPGEL